MGVVEEGVQDPLFPKDLFTPQQNRQGAVVLHIIGKTEYIPGAGILEQSKRARNVGTVPVLQPM